MTSSKLPDGVTLLGVHFDVVVEPLEEGLCGDTSVYQRMIRVDSLMSREVQWETLHHEVAHAILRLTGISELLGEELEESVAQSLGLGLLTLSWRTEPNE